MQFQTQMYLRQAVAANHAKGGTVIVMDPRTGEIYAMATYPTFDPNAFSTADQSDVGEPSGDRHLGAGLGEQDHHSRGGALVGRGASDRHVPGPGHAHHRGVHDPRRRTARHRNDDPRDIIAHSSNVGISLVADRVGNQRLGETFHAFGYGAPTGVGFPGEATG
jgi:cell division protein FtsI (penicillin-binding protein 3)